MKIKIFGGLLIALIAVTSIANAQTSTPAGNHRQQKQERRITRAVRHHRISEEQAYHLRKDEHMINEQRRMAIANGRYNHREHKHLRREEARIHHALRRDERANKVS